jgi:DNA-directed RNA polymerase subunit RPC12/RpoP
MMTTPPELHGQDARTTATTTAGTVRCPYCRSFNVRNSRTRIPQDLLPLLILQHPLRCRTCDARFLRWLWIKAPERPSN